jgi:hypothetical protein
VRIDGVKANEADEAVLDGEPLTMPMLVAAQGDPLQYAIASGAIGSVESPASHSYGDRPAPTRVAQPPPPAAWYDDPADTRMFRYWDGVRWTEHVAPKIK